jgi:hypothetical protein
MQSAGQATNRLGPFLAGSSSEDLIALVRQGELGLRVLDPDEQAREYYRARCEALESAAREFFHAYDESRSLILQKTREAPGLPEFAEYLYCWFAEDRLCGAILSGVTSDAGSHGQINEQEAAYEEHAAEVAEALAGKYPESPGAFLNPFQFEVHESPPQIDGLPAGEHFTTFERLVATPGENQAESRVGTAACGPGVIVFSGRPLTAEIPTGTTHSSQAVRKGFANDACLVIYDFKSERYVRTIESIHVYENLIYLSRTLAAEIGRRINERRRALVREDARAQIDAWRSAIDRAEEGRRARIQRLAEIL